MSKPEKKYKQTQHFVGMQVIDSKGTVIGNVKDVSADFQNRSLAFRVATKNRSELDMSWDDVQSIEDVVLLKTEVDTSKLSEAQQSPPTGESPVTIQSILICSNCGTSAPGHAKFCPKCGTALR